MLAVGAPADFGRRAAEPAARAKGEADEWNRRQQRQQREEFIS
jgi:hypothetical protein